VVVNPGRLEPDDARVGAIRHAIDHASHLLPIQGPIGVFIHHNTLHAFEQEPFEQAVLHGAETFGCEPFLSEDRYRAELFRGRILNRDLKSIVAAELGESRSRLVAGLNTRLELRLAMLQHSVWTGPSAELNWFVEETDALRNVRPDVSAEAKVRFVAETRRWTLRDLRTRSKFPAWIPAHFKRTPTRVIEAWTPGQWESFSLDAVWGVCRYGAAKCPPAKREKEPAPRHRDLLLEATGVDADEWVNDLLIRFCSAFVDQGLSAWTLPERDKGFFHSFLMLYRRVVAPLPRLRRLAEEAERLLASGITPQAAMLDSLDALGVPAIEYDEYLSAVLLALRGWAGMILQVENRGDRVAHAVPTGSLDEYVAIRLLLDRISAEHVASEELPSPPPLKDLRGRLLERRRGTRSVPTDEERAFPVFQLAQVLGWSPGQLEALTDPHWVELLGEVESFSNVERRRTYHLAYEKRFRTQSLDAMALHQRRRPTSTPRFQLVTCLDEREESFRRHLEEVAPDCETFGAAGFFNVAMYFKGAADAHYIPLCPIALTPKHWVREQVEVSREASHRRRAALRKAFGAASVRFNTGTRSFALGGILSVLIGALGAVPLVARILFPRLAAQFTGRLAGIVGTPPETRLHLEKQTDEAGQPGYTAEEMAAVGERLLRDIGLIDGFGRLIFIMGHGSDSFNNPHKSAYDCGACGGSSGAPNGRALAQMLNDPRVRAIMAKNGVVLPPTTWFVGGLHNTCNDTVSFADPDRLPESHRADFAMASLDFAESCRRNANERSRRFMSAPLDLTPPESHRHVHARSVDLAQTRPELGHATNALCLVTRRERTRGLFFDRRAFLTSYDPTQDDSDGSTLTRLLSAAVPVCGGINLEYFFSHVDNRGYGCGTKLPHNVTSLVGVMDGAASDLRTGLPWQMVEIHEPVRLLFVIETTPEILLGILDRDPAIGANVRNGWVQVSLLDPNSQRILLYRNGAFEPYTPVEAKLPSAKSSADWYRGWREHLEFAEIGS
jgi:uncharacterized protein YbcC (UPF0753/DUF2309 family)